MRFCSSKNPAFWLVLGFLDYNTRTRTFPGIFFLQKLQNYYNFHNQVEKVLINRSDFWSYFGDILGPTSPSFFFCFSFFIFFFFFWQTEFNHFSYFITISWSKNCKKTDDQFPRFWITKWWKDGQRAKFLGHSALCPTKKTLLSKTTFYFSF